ncbi:MAG: hypothetical protein CL928_01020, partial [Deltaproteobacteria bacterium]|nr:hypothetical protein [Deltaproteobacteria bacterium]
GQRSTGFGTLEMAQSLSGVSTCGCSIQGRSPHSVAMLALTSLFLLAMGRLRRHLIPNPTTGAKP